jgi:transcriptional regulator with XRE-family HTH domain
MTAKPKPPAREQDQRTTLAIGEVLPGLLQERGLTVTALAEKLHVKQSHLSRALRSADGKKVSGELAGRIAVALELGDDYFFETREARIIQRLRADPTLVDQLYDTLPKPVRGRSASRPVRSV